MRKLKLILGLLLILQSCVFIRMDDSIDLGKKYRYIQDYPQTIIFHKSQEYEGVGLNAVPPIVLSYEFNDRFIIAKNKDWESEKIQYWLIDKEHDFSEIKPMDSLTFYIALLENKIELKLK